jgi:hypothetical protein
MWKVLQIVKPERQPQVILEEGTAIVFQHLIDRILFMENHFK